ncbi:ran GTPase-activating protein 1-like [Ruditapes philippinarum]|uniref:ran GTPase-activating protein 1-like n=1 Tax=Ruditapes philippinarum TaxID=129788 RepID=UPI00295ADA96|nr:ran GTPase-activating protein 1-like [Ruditapes philippinarum]
MASDDIADVTKKLEGTKVDEKNLLSFKGKGLKLNKPEDAKEVVEAIEQCSTMTALSMEGNTLGVEAAESIAQALKKHPEFERALWSDMFTGRLKTEIPQALKYLGAAMIEANAQLVELDLSDNAFGPNGVTGIVDLLKSKTCYTLKELRLNNNGLGTTGGKMLADCLMDCYNSSKAAGTPLALEVFISGRGRLENEGSTALSEVFKLMGSLREVQMPQNGINHQGISALSQAFEHNPNLRILNLNDNTFTVKGAKSMAKVLPKLQNLEVINFGDCLIRSEGAKVIARSIQDGHKKLKELILSGNEINKQGASVVAESVENKDNLTLLDLDSNQLGEEGVELVQATLEAIGKQDILGSLSGDEGSDEEDIEDDYDESYEEKAQEDTEGDHVDDPQLQVRGTALSPKQSVNVKEFLSFPSPTKLHSIGGDLSASLRQELGNDIKDIDKTVGTLIRISTVVTEEDKKSCETVCQCADNILEEAFKEDSNVGSLFANAYLVYIGLLKGEDKKYRPPSDITGPLIVLEHIVKQTYFPHQAKKIISAFMDKPHPLLDKSFAIRGKLLQALFS